MMQFYYSFLFMPCSVYFGDAFSYFTKTSEVPLVSIETPFCQAIISLQGGQLLQFRSYRQHDWLHCPKELSLKRHQAINAGIPLCLPWFGRHAQAGFPIHGYLREQLWQIEAIQCDKRQGIKLDLSYQHLANAQFPFNLTVKQSLYFHQSLQLNLALSNQSDRCLPLSFAWHSYWQTEKSSYLQGLQQHTYLDNQDELKRKLCKEPIQFNHAMDKVFEAASVEQSLYNPQFNLHFTADNCPTRIVWQPKAQSNFACVEHGFAFADSIELAAGETTHSSLTIKEF